MQLHVDREVKPPVVGAIKVSDVQAVLRTAPNVRKLEQLGRTMAVNLESILEDPLFRDREGVLRFEGCPDGNPVLRRSSVSTIFPDGFTLG